MDIAPTPTRPAFPEDLREIVERVETAGSARAEDEVALLELLRLLEQLHQDIRENLFRSALPTNRQKLYSLLRDIEVHGGWPYIPRMKLRALLSAFALEAGDSPDHTPASRDEC